MSGGAAIRGIERHQEHAAQLVSRDTRPLGVRFGEFICKPATNLTVYVGALSSFWLIPETVDIVFIVCAAICMFATTRKFILPFKLPQTAQIIDFNDLKPGGDKPNQAQGITFFGNERFTGEELWFSNSDMRTHALIFGSTGSGKTEALVSLAYNSLIHGSGFIYVDGKGDNSLFAKIFSMVRKMGRDDDLLVINFMTGARDVVGPQTNKLSSTMNPFANGSSSMLSQLVISLMDSASNDPNGDMWKGRAINFVESLMKILTVMRDEGHILLDANNIRDYFQLEKLESIVVGKRFPIGDTGMSVPLEGYPSNVIDPIRNYVINLPGYNPSKQGKQAPEVLEQHGFITMQLTRVFGSLADTYGHILRTNLAEVDIRDVVINRRILVVLLPALEKSPEELANLGKIIIASLKAMMAAGLGEAIEGEYRDVIDRKPTNSPSPYVCIMDEYGYYAVKGFAIVAAQARSLGFSAIFAGQDLPAFQKASKEEAASIGANCNIKICMKLEDPQETWEFFNKAAGETYVTNVNSFQINPGSLTVDYMDSRTTSVDRRQRIELLDLKDQREGEAHIFFKSGIVRAEMFYANPKPISHLRVNAFLKVNVPPSDELEALFARLRNFSNVFKQTPTRLPAIQPNEDIAILANAFNNESYGLQPFERGISAMATILEHEIAAHRVLEDEYVPDTPPDGMSIFTNVPVTAAVERMIGEHNIETFAKPLVRPDSFQKDLEYIERLSGKTQDQARSITAQLFQDVEQTTEFPIDLSRPRISKEQFLVDLNKILVRLGGKPYTPDASDLPMLSPDHNLPDLPNLPELPNLPDLSDLSSMFNLEQMEEQIKNLDPSALGLDNMPFIDPAEMEKFQKFLEDMKAKSLDQEIEDQSADENQTDDQE